MGKPLILKPHAMGLMAAAWAFAYSGGSLGSLEAMGSPRRQMPSRETMPTKHDLERMNKAQAKRDRKAAKRQREGRT